MIIDPSAGGLQRGSPAPFFECPDKARRGPRPPAALASLETGFSLPAAAFLLPPDRAFRARRKMLRPARKVPCRVLTSSAVRPWQPARFPAVSLRALLALDAPLRSPVVPLQDFLF